MSTYTCENCGETYEKGWSDAESMAEAEALFGPIPEPERAVVCDDCFNEIFRNWTMAGQPQP